MKIVGFLPGEMTPRRSAALVKSFEQDVLDRIIWIVNGHDSEAIKEVITAEKPDVVMVFGLKCQRAFAEIAVGGVDVIVGADPGRHSMTSMRMMRAALTPYL